MPSQDLPPTGLDPRARAPVTPRGRATPDGETLPVEMLVEPYIEAGSPGAIRITGGRGSGRSTALRHLEAVFGRRKGLLYLDEPSKAEVEARSADAVVIFSSSYPYAATCLARIELAAWGDDDAIEYLLATRRARCASVMARLRADGDRAAALRGSPELWRIVLDELADDDAIPDVTAALRRKIDRDLPPGPWRKHISAQAMATIVHSDDVTQDIRTDLFPEDLLPFLKHRTARVLLAAEHVVASLGEEYPGLGLHPVFPSDLLLQTAALLKSQLASAAPLRDILASDNRDAHPTAAGLMLALHPSWRPAGRPLPRLTGAPLARVQWKKLDLSEAELSRADLREADLQKADLSKAVLHGANLTRARMAGASLKSASARDADFSFADLRGARMRLVILPRGMLQGADLTGADLTGAFLFRARLDGAILIRARLGQAKLYGACLDGTDFTDADLSGVHADNCVFRTARLDGAVFQDASLLLADFEGVELRAPDFRRARLTGAYMTDSVLPGADFSGAKLDQAGLAGVSWVGANLRGADLTHASFHMGSSRSGLVDSPLASEGTRTGFYTDDACEQDFKPPEEIRKADLRGADLRFARVLDTDFYLVDLRGAQYTPEQGEHFAKTGAILQDRAR